MRTILRPRVLVPALGIAAVAITTAAGAAQGPEGKATKAGRDTAAVMKDVKEGKARKVKADTQTIGVWDGCKFHYLKVEENTYEFDDGSLAGVSENPEPLPPKDPSCVATRNPTTAEMADNDRRLEELNPRQLVPGQPPPPPLPPDRYKGG